MRRLFSCRRSGCCEDNKNKKAFHAPHYGPGPPKHQSSTPANSAIAAFLVHNGPAGEAPKIDKIKVIHDAVGHTLTVWLDDPQKEYICEETAEEVVLMKDADGRVIGFELLHYRPEGTPTGFSVETVLKTKP